jgi:hypothetical protein
MSAVASSVSAIPWKPAMRVGRSTSMPWGELHHRHDVGVHRAEEMTFTRIAVLMYSTPDLAVSPTSPRRGSRTRSNGSRRGRSP